MRLEIIPFRDEHLDAAALLLSQRHQRDRRAEPALPERFEQAEFAQKAIETLWHLPLTSGVIAFSAGKAVGYLLGTPKVEPRWGRTIWTQMAGHAVDEAFGSDVYRDLYAASSLRWVESGYFEHYVLVPANDRPSLDAWFSLSFGQEQAYGIQELATISERLHPSDSALEIRLARPEDKEEVQAMAELIGRHQADSPVYAPFFPEEVSDRRKSFARLLSDPDVTFWLAFKDGQALGYQLQVPAETEADNLLIPDGCTELAVAATFAHARGQGVGQALTRHALVAAQAAGYAYCVTDWRTTNLLSSRFWPRQGFRPAYYRLRRSIDSRIAWATIR